MALLTKNTEVHFREFSPAIMSMLNVLYTLNLQQVPDWPKDFIITSVNDSSSHSAKSKHYEDKAMDVRSKNFKTYLAKLRFVNSLKSLLGDKFTIILENPKTENEHFHIQVKKGDVYP